MLYATSPCTYALALPNNGVRFGKQGNLRASHVPHTPSIIPGASARHRRSFASAPTESIPCSLFVQALHAHSRNKPRVCAHMQTTPTIV